MIKGLIMKKVRNCLKPKLQISIKIFMSLTQERSMRMNQCISLIIYTKNITNKCKKKRCNIINMRANIDSNMLTKVRKVKLTGLRWE